ncbi:MAG TPA: guanylate kinase [Candidatus Eisenbergiella intestinigallinarum]|uniref:Guanylate kinase n=1 Tax=Candidatus Eisenbergiella intestinigallinarum TaxID=2838549 RepID=A0A9D2QJB6_9FIRM|nr:guanylate kinase [Candidatus Eisenbergiella intestinigallinarum]
MKRKGILIVVSGFSGAGKGTLMKELLKRYDNYALSVSMTTRVPREGEVDGESYFFVDKETFERTIAEDGLIEYASYCGNYYGTPREYVEKCLQDGRDVILEIEIQGALKVKEKFPEALLLFVMPPSAAELKRRLEGRGTESPEVIRERLVRASEEAEGIENYEYLIINDDLDECVREMNDIINAARRNPVRNRQLIADMRSELDAVVKGE